MLRDIPKDKNPILDAVPIKLLEEELAENGVEAFLDAHRNSFLLVKDRPTGDDLAESVDYRYRTKETNIEALTAKLDQDWKLGAVLELKKSSRNKFKKRITIGRAKNNDIVIRTSRISKLHAVFLIAANKPGEFSLVDRGSTNGTFVNYKKLKKNKPVNLKSGDLISFWKYQFKYMWPKDFLDLIKPAG